MRSISAVNNVRAAASASIAAVMRARSAARRGLDTSVQRAAHAQMQRVIDAGHGADDVSRLSAALLAEPAR